jgi:hypothetical protein
VLATSASWPPMALAVCCCFVHRCHVRHAGDVTRPTSPVVVKRHQTAPPLQHLSARPRSFLRPPSVSCAVMSWPNAVVPGGGGTRPQRRAPPRGRLTPLGEDRRSQTRRERPTRGDAMLICPLVGFSYLLCGREEAVTNRVALRPRLEIWKSLRWAPGLLGVPGVQGF